MAIQGIRRYQDSSTGQYSSKSRYCLEEIRDEERQTMHSNTAPQNEESHNAGECISSIAGCSQISKIEKPKYSVHDQHRTSENAPATWRSASPLRFRATSCSSSDAGMVLFPSFLALSTKYPTPPSPRVAPWENENPSQNENIFFRLLARRNTVKFGVVVEDPAGGGERRGLKLRVIPRPVAQTPLKRRFRLEVDK
ncbi:hypothetical protein KC364_g12 [Hortaea werneckii]|nr:hypothetical protein KC364_g12 [Hortaea werneckii]